MEKNILICNPYVSAGGVGTFTLNLGRGLPYKEINLLITHFEGNWYKKAAEVYSNVYCIKKTSNAIRRLLLIYKYIEKIKPDVIILNNCPTVNFLLPFLSFKTTTISVIHSDDKRYYTRDSRFSPWIDRFVCPSEKLKFVLPSFLPHKKIRIKVIPHGVEIDDNNFEERIKKSLIFVGNLGEHKGVEFLPIILNGLKNKFPDISLNIVGDGPLKEEIFKGFKKNNLFENVNYWPYLNRKEIYKLFQTSEILLFPTRLESFGLVIPEAMSCGVIPVISDLENITDQFVENGQNGFLCDKDDPESFIAKIIEIFSKHNLEAMSMKNRILAQENFSLVRMNESYRKLIESNISRKPKRFSLVWFRKMFSSFKQIKKNEFR